MEPTEQSDPGAATPAQTPAAEPRAQTRPAGPTPAPAGERPADEPAAPRPRRRWPIVAVVVAAVLALAGTVALGVGYLAYDRATQPDRSDPEVVVRNYLVATFDRRDPQRGRLYTCGSPELAEVDGLLADLRRREAQYGVHITVASEDYNARTDGDGATVTARLRLGVDSGGVLQEQLQRWEFTLVRRSGWRVCGAHRVG